MPVLPNVRDPLAVWLKQFSGLLLPFISYFSHWLSFEEQSESCSQVDLPFSTKALSLPTSKIMEVFFFTADTLFHPLNYLLQLISPRKAKTVIYEIWRWLLLKYNCHEATFCVGTTSKSFFVDASYASFRNFAVLCLLNTVCRVCTQLFVRS